MKGFDYAKIVFCRVPSARCCVGSRPEVRQSLRGAYELGVSAAALHNWVRQRRIDRGEIDGSDFTGERAARPSGEMDRKNAELEVEILRRASKILEVGHHDPEEFTR
jgi:transposase